MGERKRHTQYSLVQHARSGTNQKSLIFSFFCFPGVPGCNIRKRLAVLLLHPKIELLSCCTTAKRLRSLRIFSSSYELDASRLIISIISIIVIIINILGLLYIGGAASSHSIRDTWYGASPSQPSQGAMLNFSTPAGHARGLPRSPTCYGSRP